MENWSDVWYLYAYPPSDRLNHALVDGSIDRVFTTPVLRHEQLLTESVSESTSLLKNQEAEDLHITEDKDGLKCLIKAGRMRRAFNLTTQLLVKMGHVPNAPIRRAACSVESLEDHISSITIYEELLEKTEDVDKKKLIMDQLLRITMALGHFKFLESLINSKIGDQVHKRTMWAVFGANYQKALDLLNQSSADSTETCNNKAICYLYTGRVKEAVEILLAHRRAPVPLMKNLYTIGDLASTNSADIRSQHFSKHCASLADLYDPAQLRVL